MGKSWQIRPSTFFGLMILAYSIVSPLPFGAEYTVPLASIPIFFILRKKKHIKPFKFIDFILILLLAMLWITLGLFIQGFALKTTPWWRILVLGMAADITASFLGMIPVWGDGLSAFINLIIAIILLGPIGGAIGLTLAIISLIPGPSLGMNTAMLIILKALVTAL